MVRSLQKNQMLKFWEFQEHQKLICCFSNELLFTTDSKNPKEALYFLTFSVASFSRSRAWKQFWSLILIQSVYVIQLQDLNTVTSACWDFLSLINSGHFLNFKVILSCLPWLLGWNGHLTPLEWGVYRKSDWLKAPDVAASEGRRFSEMSRGSQLHRLGVIQTFAPGLTQLQIISYGDVYSSRMFIINLLSFCFNVHIKAYLCISVHTQIYTTDKILMQSQTMHWSHPLLGCLQLEPRDLRNESCGGGKTLFGSFCKV